MNSEEPFIFYYIENINIMAGKKKNLNETRLDNLCDMKEKSFGIVVSEWNQDITSSLAEGARSTLLENGVTEEHISEIQVPGSFELPMGARLLAGKEKMDAIICIGCVIKGETKHDEYINNAVANGIMSLGLATSTPVIFGVLTPNDHQQAVDRAGGKYGNKGIEAAHTALRMVSIASNIKETESKIGFK